MEVQGNKGQPRTMATMMVGTVPSKVSKPVTIVEKVEKGFKLNEDALREVLTKDRIKDKPVVVVSVAGAFRLGKSFMLDFFLRFMNAKMLPGWIGAENTPLEGFSWRGGTKPETTGLVVWSELFEAEGPDGHPVAVLLMDTQGLFDNRSTASDCVNIFALSTMISSVQIFNLSGNIQEDDLQHLQYFTEYGRMALEQSGETPFQRLLFLVRNYTLTDEYGLEGGRKLLKEMLEVKDDQDGELQMLRERIRESFSEVDCFLMPHPGKNVSKAGFDGSTRYLDKDFKEQLQVLVPHVLSKENLVVKKIGGTVIRVEELIGYISSYFNALNSDALPEPRTLLRATAEATNMVAVEKAKEHYDQQLCDMFGDRDVFIYVDEETLKNKHDITVDSSVDVFKKSGKMGGEDLCNAYEGRLLQELSKRKDYYSQLNRNNYEVAKKSTGEAVDAAIRKYKELLDALFPLEESFVAEKKLHTEHRNANEKSRQMYRATMKFGREDLWMEHEKKLLTILYDTLQAYVTLNQKNTEKAKRLYVEQSKAEYDQRMGEIFADKSLFVDDSDLRKMHIVAKDFCLKLFAGKAGKVVVEENRDNMCNEATTRQEDMLNMASEGASSVMPNDTQQNFSDAISWCKEDYNLLEMELERMYDRYLLINKGVHETAHEQNDGILQAALVSYMHTMDAACEDIRTEVFDAGELERQHNIAKKCSMDLFREANKMGDKMFIERYQEELIQKLGHMFHMFHMYVGKNYERRQQAQRDNNEAVTAAKKNYSMRLRELTDKHPNKFIEEAELEKVERAARVESLNIFKKTYKMGGDKSSRSYEAGLKEEWDNTYTNCLADNASKLSIRPSGVATAVAGVSGAVAGAGVITVVGAGVVNLAYSVLAACTTGFTGGIIGQNVGAAGLAAAGTIGTGMVVVGAPVALAATGVMAATTISKFFLKCERTQKKVKK